MTADRSSVVLPSMEVVASVRHAEPTADVPDELVAFVLPVYADDRLADWQLTNDAIAFGEPTVVRTFDEWRAGWQKSLVLDSVSNLACLVDIATGLPDVAGEFATTTLARVVAGVGDGSPITVEAAAAHDLATSVELVRDAIRNRNETGFGFVNATPGHDGRGLARAWSPARGSELLAADDNLAVTMHPASGLHVDVVDGDRVAGVTRVEFADDEVRVHHDDPGGVLTLDPGRARPLAWTVSNATVWKVVAVPDVLVWANTFGRLVESCQYAAAVDRPLRFTVDSARLSDAPTRS